MLMFFVEEGSVTTKEQRKPRAAPGCCGMGVCLEEHHIGFSVLGTASALLLPAGAFSLSKQSLDPFFLLFFILILNYFIYLF